MVFIFPKIAHVTTLILEYQETKIIHGQEGGGHRLYLMIRGVESTICCPKPVDERGILLPAMNQLLGFM